MRGGELPSGARWRRDRVTSGLYDAGVERERVGRLFGHLLWGADLGRFYGERETLRSLAEDSSVLDVPCGGGVLIRALGPRPGLHYVAADLSALMLGRARRRAVRGHARPRFVQADAESLPFLDARFDLCLAYFGLHCYPNPALAVAELARVLKPGGVVRGTAIVAGAGRSPDAVIELALRVGLFASRLREESLRAWLTASPLEAVQVETSGAVAFFSARRPDRRP
jgi:ubiquinone/menaquinone biosynthesis C-methylase UbiE